MRSWALRKSLPPAAEFSTEFLERLINSVADPIFVKDSAHRWILLNDAYCSLFGEKRENLIGRSDYDFFPKEEADVFWEKDRVVFETGQVNENEELFTDSYGRVHTVLTRKSRYYDASGAVYLVGTIRDITDRKEAESRSQQLIAEKQARQWNEAQRKVLEGTATRLRDILEAIPVGVFVLDAKGGLAQVNSTSKKIWGGDTPDFQGIAGYGQYRGWWANSHRELKPEDWPSIRTVREGMVCLGEVIDILRFDGQVATILFSSAPLRDPEGRLDGAVVALQDITELKRAKETAETASRMKSEFLDIAAHELKTPLTSATVLSELASKQLGKGESSTAVYLDKLREQIKRLGGLVDDLLNASRLERGALMLHPERVDLNRLVADCVETFQLHSGGRKLVLKSAGEPVFLDADPARIAQVLGNLLDNALVYASQGPIDVRVEKVTKENMPFARVSVSDQGPGIPKEKQKDLFTRFYRVFSDEALRHPGLGLGLFISRRIMELHGGSLQVSSEPGEGSTFYFEIPA